jgi:2-aminoadipate transaminase
MIVSRWFDEYDVHEHIRDIQKIYRRKLNLMCESLDEYCSDFISYVRPEGGLFIWARLDDKIDMMQYVKKLLEYKVAVVPGSAFMINDTAPCQYIRLNFSTPSDENIVKGVKLMAEAINELKVKS